MIVRLDVAAEGIVSNITLLANEYITDETDGCFDEQRIPRR
jgi:hypothetical protein